MRGWKLGSYDLIPVGHGITEQFTKKLTERGLPPEAEINDGLILAEASLSACSALVTSDRHLLNIEPEHLFTVFQDSDLQPVTVAHPRNLLRAAR